MLTYLALLFLKWGYLPREHRSISMSWNWVRCLRCAGPAEAVCYHQKEMPSSIFTWLILHFNLSGLTILNGKFLSFQGPVLSSLCLPLQSNWFCSPLHLLGFKLTGLSFSSLKSLFTFSLFNLSAFSFWECFLTTQSKSKPFWSFPFIALFFFKTLSQLTAFLCVHLIFQLQASQS